MAGVLKSSLAVVAGAVAGGWKSGANAQTEPAHASVLHVAMNVANMERTTRFYTEVFGFKASPPITPNAQATRIFGLPKPPEIKAGTMRLGSTGLLIRQFDRPKYDGPTRDLARDLSRLGR